MTQEELNELILSNFNDNTKQQEDNESLDIVEENPFNDNETDNKNDDNYRVNATGKWPPPPPTNEHKVVHQLDDVTKGLEAKATQVFDQLESISQNSENVQEDLKIIKNHIENQKKIFEKLSTQFPNIKIFHESLEQSKDSLKRIISVEEKIINNTDCILQAMDIMQYQDIYRQKIERVVNVTRALSKYLNSIFDTDIEDNQRVSSASYIKGDNNSDIVSSDELNELIASLGKK